MSHELRTPLNAILGFTQLLELDAGRSERDLESLRRITHAGRHCSRSSTRSSTSRASRRGASCSPSRPSTSPRSSRRRWRSSVPSPTGAASPSWPSGAS
ncbi:MAG: hypothetical protein M3P39_10685, partial [Actinomycetota bacterium]|nr:hypothetical protein [Actinomycetota bacterium]